MDKAFLIQKQARDNVKEFQSYMTDLQNWESEMKRKEAALNGDFEQDLPPVRSKIKKEKPLVKVEKQPEQRILSSDYSAWEKFDVDKACEEVDMEDVGPTSLDSKMSRQTKLEKLREEAQYEKERGNNFVKQEKWSEAITCYNRAIELVKDDAIYYANRGLCHLKKESLHLAESDCTEALRLDPTYVKAYQRRAVAREKLGSLRAACKDLEEVLRLEPKNVTAKRHMETIKTRMGSKGVKSKSSPATTPATSSEPITTTAKPKIEELPEDKQKSKEKSPRELWRAGIGENINVIKPVKKPPHLRSKRPLKSVDIKEVPLGKTSPVQPTRMKIIEITDAAPQSDDNSPIISTTMTNVEKSDETSAASVKINGHDSPESKKLNAEVLEMEKDLYRVEDMVPPANSVQFVAEWKSMKGKGEARSDYLSIIDPQKIPAIFTNSLESGVLSELLVELSSYPDKFKGRGGVAEYLRGVRGVRRFGTLAMFLSSGDKQLVTNLLVHCKKEGCSETEIADLKNAYEL